MGYHTLCDKCNNDTGAWYGDQFVNWCYQGMKMLVRASGKPSLIYLNKLFPLPILKQIATMFFSVNSEIFRIPNEEMVRFVMNKNEKYLSPKYRFFVYYNTTGRFRASGSTGLLNVNTGKISVISEITYPPFGYVMTIASEPPDNRLFEITHFARYDYNEFKEMPLELSVLPTHLFIPGDYREKDQIYRDAAMQPEEEN
ncbi:MAG: hypothetical protein A2521_01015 [Deltaproteobacteria bacterium RIFOXYD12_FULL_57_12]|nr:MAG: hypothetical protein A2521_01015 [Deltaproteobacteria bacterium RIFOXYD12_FULL_57_12]